MKTTSDPSQLNPKQKQLIWAVDVGGTNTQIGAVDQTGNVECIARCTTPNAGTGEELVTWIRDAIKRLGEVPPSGGSPKSGCIALPGRLDESQGHVVSSVNLPALRNFPIRDRLNDATSLTWSAVTDAAAATWGEYKAVEKRLAATTSPFAHLRLGTGIALGLVINGKVRIPDERTGEHLDVLRISDRGEPCLCGARGCLEAIASGNALSLEAKSAGYAELTDLAARYAKNDFAAIEIIARAAQALSCAIRNVAERFGAESFVIGGGVVNVLPALVQRAAEQTIGSCGASRESAIQIELSQAPFAPLSGASMLANA